MKHLILATLLLFGLTTQAAQIQDARVNLDNMTIEIDVAYGGGCADHFFDIQVGACLESFPVQCTATLLHTSSKPDFCEAYLSQTVIIPMEEKGLLDSYYERARLTIIGAGDTKATVRLP